MVRVLLGTNGIGFERMSARIVGFYRGINRVLLPAFIRAVRDKLVGVKSGGPTLLGDGMEIKRI